MLPKWCIKFRTFVKVLEIISMLILGLIGLVFYSWSINANPALTAITVGLIIFIFALVFENGRVERFDTSPTYKEVLSRGLNLAVPITMVIWLQASITLYLFDRAFSLQSFSLIIFVLLFTVLPIEGTSSYQRRKKLTS